MRRNVINFCQNLMSAVRLKNELFHSTDVWKAEHGCYLFLPPDEVRSVRRNSQARRGMYNVTYNVILFPFPIICRNFKMERRSILECQRCHGFCPSSWGSTCHHSLSLSPYLSGRFTSTNYLQIAAIHSFDAQPSIVASYDALAPAVTILSMNAPARLHAVSSVDAVDHIGWSSIHCRHSSCCLQTFPSLLLKFTHAAPWLRLTLRQDPARGWSIADELKHSCIVYEITGIPAAALDYGICKFQRRRRFI